MFTAKNFLMPSSDVGCDQKQSSEPLYTLDRVLLSIKIADVCVIQNYRLISAQ